MIIKLALAILLAVPAAAAAQEKMADQLRKAIVEEEVNQKLDKAIEAYARILAQYDEDRKVAATALFHFAECCRKLGQKDQAIGAFQRVLRDFGDQTALADASRNQLDQTYGISAGREQVAKTQIEQYLLQQEVVLVEKQIQDAERQVQLGLISANGSEIVKLKKELLELKLRIESLRKGIVAPAIKK